MIFHTTEKASAFFLGERRPKGAEGSCPGALSGTSGCASPLQPEREQSRFLPCRREVQLSIPLGSSKMLKAAPPLPGPWQQQRALQELESFLCPLFAGPSFLSVKATGMNQVSWMWKSPYKAENKISTLTSPSTKPEKGSFLKTGTIIFYFQINEVKKCTYSIYFWRSF